MKGAQLIVLLVVCVLVFSFWDLATGTSGTSFTNVIGSLMGVNENPQSEKIFWLIRVPKTLTAILCGIALSLSGLQMQTLFRNPLAGPYILGISSGASLGVALMIMGGVAFGVGMSGAALGVIISACLGALGVLLIVFLISLRTHDIMTLLVMGVLLGSAITALISVLEYFSPSESLKSFVVWSLGDLGGVSSERLGILVWFILAGIVIAIVNIKSLNTLLLGEDYAKNLGVNINVVKLSVILSTGILAGSVTAFCGPIGFIGIVVPHLGRMLFNTSDHKYLVPGCMLIGACFLLISDVLTKISYGMILPINAITALLGIPIIAWILIRRKQMKPL